MTIIKKYSFGFIIVAAVVIEVMGAAQSILTNNSLKKELIAKAERDLQESQRVASMKVEVETEINNAEQSVRQGLNNPDTCYRIASNIIIANSHVIGAGVAFVPGYYKEKGKDNLYLPYTFDSQPSIIKNGKRTGDPDIRTSIPNFDYTSRDWYKSAMKRKRQWSSPYLGKGSISVLMCTYSIPLTDDRGEIVGVLFADVTMEDATMLMNNMSTSIRRNRVITIGIQLVSLLLLGFIVWRAFVASRRFKEHFIDVERSHLINEVTKTKDVNARLIKRNQELAEKVAELQLRLNNTPQKTDQHFFG